MSLWPCCPPRLRSSCLSGLAVLGTLVRSITFAVAQLVLAMAPVSMRSALVLAGVCLLAALTARGNEDVAVCGGFVKLAPELLGYVGRRVCLCLHRVGRSWPRTYAAWARIVACRGVVACACSPCHVVVACVGVEALLPVWRVSMLAVVRYDCGLWYALRHPPPCRRDPDTRRRGFCVHV